MQDPDTPPREEEGSISDAAGVVRNDVAAVVVAVR
jgi:hypothetical protein